MKKKKKSNGIILILILGALAFVGFKGYSDYKTYSKAWKVEITNPTINVRSGASATDTLLGVVKQGKKYVVLDINLEDDKYVWYKIEYQRAEYGWISSLRSSPYVKEINNPDIGTGVNKTDYKAPVVRFYDEVYYTINLKSINYNHLSITDDSMYEITHKVYFEETPVDRATHQYWIEYIVTDEFGNSTSKVQRIEFQNEPNPSEVLDFSDLKENRGQ